MAVVLVWTVASVLVAAIGGLLVLGAGLALRSVPAEAPHDPLVQATARAFHRDLTQTGRIRLMLGHLAQREADAAGRPLEPRGMRRASV